MSFVVSWCSCAVNHNDVLVKIFLVNKQTVPWKGTAQKSPHTL